MLPVHGFRLHLCNWAGETFSSISCWMCMAHAASIAQSNRNLDIFATETYGGHQEGCSCQEGWSHEETCSKETSGLQETISQWEGNWYEERVQWGLDGMQIRILGHGGLQPVLQVPEGMHMERATCILHWQCFDDQLIFSSSWFGIVMVMYVQMGDTMCSWHV